MSVMDLVSDLMPESRSNIRHGSPNVRHPETPTMSAFSPDSPDSPDSPLGPIVAPICDADGYPSDFCQNCGGGHFHESGGWWCSRCYASETLPSQTFTIPGGTTAQGALQDVERILRRSIAGTPITVEALRSALDHADLDDVRHGRITVRNLQAFVATLDVKPHSPAGPVRCVNCAHFNRRDSHPHLGRCSAGVPAEGAAGLWDTDRRHCTLFSVEGSGDGCE